METGTNRKRPDVTIRIWDGPTVRGVFTVGRTSSSWIGAPGGAGNSTRPDIEMDPWAGLVVDHRVKYPSPIDFTKDYEVEPEEDDEPEDPEDYVPQLGKEHDKP